MILPISLPFFSQVGRSLGHDPSSSQDTVLDPFSSKVTSLQVTAIEFPASIPFKTVAEFSMVLLAHTEGEILINYISRSYHAIRKS